MMALTAMVYFQTFTLLFSFEHSKAHFYGLYLIVAFLALFSTLFSVATYYYLQEDIE